MKIAATLVALVGIASVANAQSSVLRVDIQATRGRGSVVDQTDAAVRAFARLTAAASADKRHRLTLAGRYRRNVPFSLPVRVRAYRDGHEIASNHQSRVRGDIVLVFDSTGTRAFPANYQAFLQSAYASAKPFMDQVFGTASMGGPVHVRNFDTDIGDREAIAGGYYLQDNGSGEREIRFPIYSSPDAAAVNIVHTILLAYLANTSYAFDAYQEGLVRAATITIARTPGAMPGGTTLDGIQSVLDNSYDRGETYDWLNQRPLGGKLFIAPNLAGGKLPPSGGTGLFLSRYAMSGTAWAKLLVEYPTFISAMNLAVEAQPSLGQDPSALQSLGQTILNTQRPADPTVEGYSFAEWVNRQFVLETHTTAGSKLFLDTVPVKTGLVSGDFGVFIFDATWFKTTASGDETLPNDIAYPIYWDPNFNRLFPSQQDNTIGITAGDGSVEPNFGDNGDGQYRVIVDVPVQDQIARVAVPVGSIQTGTQSVPNDFYGTVEGVPMATGDSLVVRVWVNGVSLGQDVPVKNGAFGITIGSQLGYTSAATVILSVVKVNGQGTFTQFARKVDKLGGPLAVRLRFQSEGAFTYNPGLIHGIQMIGFPVDPFLSRQEDVLGIPTNFLLVARYNPTFGRYDLNPDVEAMTQGHGYFVRLPNALPGFTVKGRATNMPVSIALKPGWNMIGNPFAEIVPPSQITVEHTSDFPITYSAAIGTLLGTTIFQFAPGENDPYSGAPENGTMSPVASLAPGQAYFVRNLSADVVVLTISPAQAGRGQFGGQAPPPGVKWRMAAVLTDNTRGSYVDLGQSDTATDGFDPAEDSYLPVGVGGLQAWVEGSLPMFRDMRKSGSTEVYTMHADGMKVGRIYEIRFELEAGALNSFYLFDQVQHYRTQLQPGHYYRFRATSNSQVFSIKVLGGQG